MNKLRELRILRKLKQSDMAKILNTSISNISGWELDKWQPDINMLRKISNYFNVSIDYLVGNENEEGIIINNNLSDTENLLVEKVRKMNYEQQKSLIDYANFILNFNQKGAPNNANVIDISDLDEVARVEVQGYIRGLKKNLIPDSRYKERNKLLK